MPPRAEETCPAAAEVRQAFIPQKAQPAEPGGPEPEDKQVQGARLLEALLGPGRLIAVHVGDIEEPPHEPERLQLKLHRDRANVLRLERKTALVRAGVFRVG